MINVIYYYVALDNSNTKRKVPSFDAPIVISLFALMTKDRWLFHLIEGLLLHRLKARHYEAASKVFAAAIDITFCTKKLSIIAPDFRVVLF